MERARSFPLVLLVSILTVALPSAVAQVSLATLPAGNTPLGVAVNPMTNKTYVANYSDGTVTVIDGATNTTATVSVGVYPDAIAVNPATNKIYVANDCGNDPTCASTGTVSVIDGATNNVTPVNVDFYPDAIGIDSTTNKIYVANSCGVDPSCFSAGTVTVIDGVSNSTASVTVGTYPYDVKVNATTNRIYAVNNCGDDTTCSSNGTVTVIDGASNTVLTSVTVGVFPYFVRINPTTNKIYVANNCGNDLTCASTGTVTAIDGVTNSPTAINVGAFPYGLAVNPVTNQIYAVNQCGSDLTCASGGTVTVIDGATNNTTAVNVGAYPNLVAVNSATNKIYVTNYCGGDLTCQSAGTVTQIDGASNKTIPIAVGDDPESLAVNATTNTVYVPNSGDAAVSVVGGATTLQLVNVTPCRLLDTRPENGGGGPIEGGTFQTFYLPQLSQGNGCGDLSSAAAYSLNVTLVPINGGSVGYLAIWPASQFQPLVSTMNSDGRVKANAAIVVAGVSGGISVYVANTANVVLDIDGYFGPAGQSTLAFYPLPPCRVADTRDKTFPQGLGPPSLTGGVPRDFPVLNATSCDIPNTAKAYSLNFTAVPIVPLGYLSVWPTGQKQPVVSTLNAFTGAVTANAAIVPAGSMGEISTYASDNTDLVIDINGYFAAPGQNGLSLYPTPPCRVLDTRGSDGNGPPFSGELTVDVLNSVCEPPSQAQAYVFNATVVPTDPLGFLALWPDGGSRPLVSTLNAFDGAVTSNMAIVPAGTQGKIDAYASDLTQLILDISSYFAP